MDFTYENQGHITYLTYAISSEDVVDTMSLGMITNNKISGLAPAIYTQMDATKYIKYNVSAHIPVQQFFSGSVSKKHLIGVFKGIISAILNAEDYMIDLNSMVLDLDYIFTDVSTCEVLLICLPILDDNNTVNLNMFFKNIMFSTQFDQTENCDYVAKIINYLNSSPLVSLTDFRNLLEETEKGTTVDNQPAEQSASVIKASSHIVQSVINQEKNPNSVVSITKQNIQQVQHDERSITTKQNENVKPVVSTPVIEQKNVIHNVEEKLSKKKGGLFGLFLRGEKQNETNETKKKSATTPIKTSNSNFAIPGQKIPVNSNESVTKNVPKIDNSHLKDTVATYKDNAQQLTRQTNVQNTTQQEQVQSMRTPIVNTLQQVASVNQVQSMNFGETTVLGGGSIGETTVLGAAPTAAQPKPHLIRAKNNEKINLDKPVFRIGKEKSYVDYFIGDNTAISRSHANFISRDGEYFVTDTNSTNHTYLNGAMLQSNVEAKLTHGDKVRLANEDFEFKLY